MRSFFGLLKREWLEHKGAFLWAPGVVLIFILLAGLMTTTVDSSMDVEISEADRVELSEKIEQRVDLNTGEDLSFLEMVAAMAFDVAGSTDEEMKSKMASLLWGVSMPFQIVLMIVAFFALLASLYDERKDQSLLFWKSMPVSDLQTVASKLVFVLWVAPLVTIAMIIVAQFFAILLSSIFVESGMGGRIWAASFLWWRPLELVVGYFILALWALPVATWLMLVSSYVSRLPILWAVGVPWVAALIEGVFLDSGVLTNAFSEHIKVLFSSPISNNANLFEQLDLLANPRMWIGVAVAGGLFYATLWCRGRFNDA